MNKTMESCESKVSRLAYELWEMAGRPTGRDLEFWLAAEGKLREKVTPVTEPAIKVAATQPAVEKVTKTSKAARGTKKTWPKPYPALPKF
jgi:hypothetical protein